MTLAAVSAAVGAQESGGANVYDCRWCQRHQAPGYRRAVGCRLDDPGAVAEMDLVVLDHRYDRCPAPDVASVWAESVFELAESSGLGFGLPAAADAPNPLVAGQTLLSRARLAIRSATNAHR